MPFSHSSTWRWIAFAFAVIPIAFGINAILNPTSALSFFELPYPTHPEARNIIDPILVVYGARDIFMGFALWAAAVFGTPKATGWIYIGCGLIGFVDGVVCKTMIGAGEWNHWSYAPMLFVLGGIGAAGL
jgi:hypothetical protein